MPFLLLFFSLALLARAELTLPRTVTFQGEARFAEISKMAQAENWRKLPIGERLTRIALALEGTPYKGFTLEIHDTVESPSVNLHGLDCWTFFETCLAWARMLEKKQDTYTPEDLLRQIEHTRYRGGVCHGNYLDRLHYLVDWYQDNDRRGTVTDLTRRFPTQRMPAQAGEMTKLWKHYRYLKHNPALRTGMGVHEARLNKTAVYMIPKNQVAALEPKLRNGDIIGIARNDGGSFCSHVGIIVVDQKGTRRFMHASTTYKKVVIDKSISEYLAQFKKHAGILVARPK